MNFLLHFLQIISSPSSSMSTSIGQSIFLFGCISPLLAIKYYVVIQHNFHFQKNQSSHQKNNSNAFLRMVQEFKSSSLLNNDTRGLYIYCPLEIIITYDLLLNDIVLILSQLNHLKDIGLQDKILSAIRSKPTTYLLYFLCHFSDV